MNQLMESRTRTGPSLDQLSVADAMHPGVVTCPLETPLRDVAWMMGVYRIHAVVVYGEPGEEGPELWGVISDLDLVDVAAAGDFEERIASQIAATPLAARRAVGLADTRRADHERARGCTPGRRRPLVGTPDRDPLDAGHRPKAGQLAHGHDRDGAPRVPSSSFYAGEAAEVRRLRATPLTSAASATAAATAGATRRSKTLGIT
jgi:CBS domain-containing protein